MSKINAKIVADSINVQGDRLTTLEVIMPRYILAEFNTHRMFTRNSASSRAIPFKKMVQEVQDNPFIPMAWQIDHKGMQGTEYFTHDEDLEMCEAVWNLAKQDAINRAEMLNINIKVTKQLANRLLEAFMMHKVLVSATEWSNFFELRCPQYVIYAGPEDTEEYKCSGKSWKEILKSNNGLAGDFADFTILERLKCNKGQADIHMMELAECIYDTMNESTPKLLQAGEYHIPYGETINIGELIDYSENGDKVEVEAIKCKVGIALAARTSYTTVGEDGKIFTIEENVKLYDRLLAVKHLSPFEHVARCMSDNEYDCYAHDVPRDKGNPNYLVDRQHGWCKNYKGYIQLRAELEV